MKKEKEDISTLNIGNARYKLIVSGAEEALIQLNELEQKLSDVMKLISKLQNMDVTIDLYEAQFPKEGD